MTNLFVILLILIISEKLYIVLAAFFFGYIVGYNLFEMFKHNNKKDEIHEFVSSYKKSMIQAIDEISNLLESIKLAKDNFLGKDLILIISEKLCIVLVAFFFGYIVGYNLFKMFKYHNKKDEFTNSFQVTKKKKMAQATDEISNLLDSIKPAKDNFLGKDFSIERNFCDAVSELLGKELKNYEVSTFLGKKIMAICCETFVLNEITGKKLLKVIDEMVDEHLF